jgi:hypothetical protein
MIAKWRLDTKHCFIRYLLLSYAFITLLLLLSGCSLFKKPFASVSADSIDESSPQRPARIRLSPPQVFTRGQLINDRLREAGFLNDQLTNSASAVLGTSLARDLQTISALSAQLSISFDPATKINFQRQNQLADLQQQIDVVQLQGQLLTLKNQLQALQNGTGAGPAAPASSPTTSVASGTSTTSSDTRITSLQSRIDTALTALASLGTTTRQNAVTGTLEDEFEDRLALRNRIREAINANALDDAHDIDGNALYHLQFTATLLPDEKKSQFGVASIKVEPPHLNQDDVNLLYYTWLATMTNRMNQNIDDRKDVKSAMSYEMLGPVTGLYDVAHMKLPRGNNPKFEVLLAVRPGDKDGFEYDIDIKDEQNEFAKHLKGLTEASRGQCLSKIHDYLTNLKKSTQPDETKIIKTFSNFTSDCSIPTLNKEFAEDQKKQTKCQSGFCKIPIDEMFIAYEAVIRVVPSVETTVFALGDRSLIPTDIKREAQIELSKYDEALPNARWVLSEIGKVCKRKHIEADTDIGDCDEYESPDFSVPPQFYKALFVDACKNHLVCEDVDCEEMISSECVKAAGMAYPYSVDPVLRSQRVSTVASAANALDLAAAVTAQLPQYGAGVGADMGYSRRAAGRVDTIERVPQVFGFAGPIRYQDDPQKQTYEFGWVFGPKMSLDANGNNLVLRQEARTQQVSADISVPAWWPRASLKVRTAWKGAFVGGGNILSDARSTSEDTNAYEKTSDYDEYSLPVRFNLNPSAFDALTVNLARAITGQGFHQARIDMVRPSVIPVCADATNKSITILIYGIDLWRYPTVIFGGQPVPASGVSVLPDMTGIAATIDTSLLSKASLDSDPTLVVWTAHGAAETTLKTRISATCESTAGETAGRTPDKSSTILAASPSQISMCDSNVDITVMGTNLSTKMEDYYLGTIRATGITRVVDDDNRCVVENDKECARVSSKQKTTSPKNVQTVTLTFENLLKANNKGLTTLVLSMIRPDGVASATIDVGGTSCGSAKSTTPPPFTFISAISTLAPGGDHTGKLRVLLTFPAGQKFSIEISATGGEIMKAVLVDAKPSKSISLVNTGGVVTVGTSVIPTKDAKPIAVDLSFRNLIDDETLILTANAKPADGSKIDAIPLAIALNSLAQHADDKAKSSAVPQPFTFTNSISAITPASDNTATMRVLLTFPLGKKIPSIAISAKGGEILSAAFSDPKPPVNVLPLQTSNGTVTVTASAIPSKDAKPFGIDITFKNLVIGQTLTLTATAKPSTAVKADPINVKIAPGSCAKVVTTTQ